MSLVRVEPCSLRLRGACKCPGEQLNSPVVERLNKGLMAVSSPFPHRCSRTPAPPYTVHRRLSFTKFGHSHLPTLDTSWVPEATLPARYSTRSLAPGIPAQENLSHRCRREPITGGERAYS
eukprot:2438910-Pyramimonas_sp.AAC.1